MRKILKEDFFERDTKIVARELLGKFLVRNVHDKEISAMITEAEAYDGPHDLASHASKGKTERTKIMFGKPGTFYIYLVYGMHYMLNVVAREKEYPAAVLIRGIVLHGGPGKVTKLFHIDKSLNGKMAGKVSGLWFEDRGVALPKSRIKKLPRIGVNYAGPIWSSKKLRFILNLKS